MNMMLDFETLGTEPRTVVNSLGVVLFDESRILSRKFFKFNVQSQLDIGRNVTEETLAWWITQSKEAQRVFTVNGNEITLDRFIDELLDWLSENKVPSEVKVWGNGATFDVMIAEDIFRQFRRKIPWHFGNVRCYRTIMKENGFDTSVITRTGIKHDALDDAVHQTQTLLAYWRVKGMT